MSSATEAGGAIGNQILPTLLKNLPGMAYRFVNDGHWTTEYASEGTLELTGWRPEELVGNRDRTIFNLVHPDDIEPGYAKVKAALADQRPYQLTYRIITRDRRVKWVFEQGQGVFDKHGRPEAAEGFISDITLQKEAQMALAKSERNFRAIFESANFGIFRSTPDGRFQALNPEAARIIGYDDPDEALARINDIACDVYVNPAERRRFVEAISRDGEVSEWLSEVRHRNGNVMRVMEKSRGVFGPDGELIYIEGTVKDVTREMAARAALEESERHASELRIQLADAQLRALRLQLKPHFLFNVLNTISMMIRIGETGKAQRMAAMLGEMFRHVLELDGTDTITLKRELEFCELYLSIQQYRFEDRLEIDWDVDVSIVNHQVPTLMLQPIFENAIKYGVARISGPCRVSVKAGREEDSLIVEISNDIPAATNEASTGHGIGVTNTHARLNEIFGDRASFRLVPDNGYMRAILSLPIAGEES